MANQEEMNKSADEVMQTHLSAQAAQALNLRRIELRQARFMHVASVALALIYVGFIASRMVQARPFEATNLFGIGLMVFCIAATRKRYLTAKNPLGDR